MPNPVLALAIAVAVGAVTLAVFWPDKGLFWTWKTAAQTTERVLIEDALKHSHHYELSGQCPTIQSIAGDLSITVNEAANVVAEMENRGLLTRKNGLLCLTPEGRAYALQIIRAHRLWERYLADETGFAQAEWHDRAERHEHLIQPEEMDALSSQLGNPLFDPHGDPIPTASGELIAHQGQPLTTATVDQPWRIVHLEDEPEVVYAQLLAEGLHPGMIVQVTEKTPHRIRFWAELDEHVLAPIVASNVSVVPVPQDERPEESAGVRLSSLAPGREGHITLISRAMSAPERRRLMDLGILPGTMIRAEMPNPVGDPVAYLVRDTLIALRKEQADQIFITEEVAETSS
jgi:DtxR family transcriptional regulator, Mn-dependent transcriptional regulator